MLAEPIEIAVKPPDKLRIKRQDAVELIQSANQVS